MKALISDAHGIGLKDIDRPRPGPQDVLVRVHAASLNRADLHVAKAKTNKPFGMEWAGEVIECGNQAPLRLGDRVICTGMGGFAEYAVADAGRTIPIPANYAWDEASVLGLGLQTMHDALVTNGRLAAGEAVLVHGASTAVGLLALQIARRKRAALVIGTSTSAEKRARLGMFGADLAIDSGSPDWVQQVLDATGGRGADLVIDQLAGPGFSDTMQATAIRGRIVNVGRLAGDTANFNFDLHASRRLEYVGVTFRTRSAEEVRTLNNALLDDLGDAIAGGAFRLPIQARFTLANAPEALEFMALNRHFGKLVIAT